MRSCSRRTQAALFMLALASATTVAQATKVTLDVSPATDTSGTWVAGDLVEVVIRVASDGDDTHGFHGGDFKSGDFAISVLDPTKLKIHDVWGIHPIDGLKQIDTQTDALLTAGNDPSYKTSEDTWVYSNFTDFVGSVDVSDTSLEAVASATTAAGFGQGSNSNPVSFLHMVFEVQPSFGPGQTASVVFYGQVNAYNTAEQDTTSDFFGTQGLAVNTGAFVIEMLPEPSAVAIFLAGLGVLARKRHWRRK